MRGFPYADLETILVQLEPAIALFSADHTALWGNQALEKILVWSPNPPHPKLSLDQFVHQLNQRTGQSAGTPAPIDCLDLYHAIDKAIAQNRPLSFTQTGEWPLQIVPTPSGGYGLIFQSATLPTAIPEAAPVQELGTLKSRFVSMISHEFRTPMSTILSAAELLEHYGQQWDADDRLAQLQLIQNTVQHMTQVLDDILLISRADTQKIPCHTRWLDVSQFCRELIIQYQHRLAPQHTLHLTLHPQHITTWIDDRLLRQILTHLLSNAVKYSPTGSTVDVDEKQQYNKRKSEDKGKKKRK